MRFWGMLIFMWVVVIGGFRLKVGVVGIFLLEEVLSGDCRGLWVLVRIWIDFVKIVEVNWCFLIVIGKYGSE